MRKKENIRKTKRKKIEENRRKREGHIQILVKM